MKRAEHGFTSVEICAGAGGQAVGLHEAGFRHLALIEIDGHACDTLRENVKAQKALKEDSGWENCQVIEDDLTKLSPPELRKSLHLEPGDLDLLAGGVPCPPFSVAGKQLGQEDERDLFPKMLELVEEFMPKAVMIENVRGLLDRKFESYRASILWKLESLGYQKCYWKVLEAKDYGVPQLRPRAILVAMQRKYKAGFTWTAPREAPVVTVGEALKASMRARFDAVDDPRADEAFAAWLASASKDVAPTVVGGSKKHGGADLGPSRAKKAWRDLGVCGMGVANESAELKDRERDLFSQAGPKLTVSQAAIIQGFPEYWKFAGRKTAAYRQVGNAFPPPVAKAVGEQIRAALARDGADLKLEEAEAAELFTLTDLSVPRAAQCPDRGDDLEGASVR